MNELTLTTLDATRKALFRLIISGGRTFSDRALLFHWADYYLRQKVQAGYTIIIVEGGQRRHDPVTQQPLPSADRLAAEYAAARGFGHLRMNADWKLLGKAAGPRRNQEMADYGHALLAFWNEKSPGTGNMITLAKRKGLPVRVIICDY